MSSEMLHQVYLKFLLLKINGYYEFEKVDGARIDDMKMMNFFGLYFCLLCFGSNLFILLTAAHRYASAAEVSCIVDAEVNVRCDNNDVAYNLRLIEQRSSSHTVLPYMRYRETRGKVAPPFSLQITIYIHVPIV